VYKAAVPPEPEDVFMLVPFLMFVLIWKIIHPFLTSLVSEFYVVIYRLSNVLCCAQKFTSD